MKNTFHFICTVRDSINNYQEIGSTYCDVKTPAAAKKYFKNNDFIKRYLGNKRYEITFKQNSFLLQDSHDFLTNWKKQK